MVRNTEHASELVGGQHDGPQLFSGWASKGDGALPAMDTSESGGVAAADASDHPEPEPAPPQEPVPVLQPAPQQQPEAAASASASHASAAAGAPSLDGRPAYAVADAVSRIPRLATSDGAESNQGPTLQGSLTQLQLKGA